MRTVALCLVLGLTACGGPVEATNCSIIENKNGSTSLQAILTNNTDKSVTHVGVLVETVGLEYDFQVHVPAHRSSPVITGTPHGDPPNSIARNQLGPINDLVCWARFVDFSDGSNWIVSPL